VLARKLLETLCEACSIFCASSRLSPSSMGLRTIATDAWILNARVGCELPAARPATGQISRRFVGVPAGVSPSQTQVEQRRLPRFSREMRLLFGAPSPHLLTFADTWSNNFRLVLRRFLSELVKTVRAQREEHRGILGGIDWDVMPDTQWHRIV
jgi:hypothetical protein